MSNYEPHIMPDGTEITFEQVAGNLIVTHEKLWHLGTAGAIARGINPDYWFLHPDFAETKKHLDYVATEIERVRRGFKKTDAKSNGGGDE